jgi:hypothetical protein
MHLDKQPVSLTLEQENGLVFIGLSSGQILTYQLIPEVPTLKRLDDLKAAPSAQSGLAPTIIRFSAKLGLLGVAMNPKQSEGEKTQDRPCPRLYLYRISPNSKGLPSITLCENELTLNEELTGISKKIGIRAMAFAEAEELVLLCLTVLENSRASEPPSFAVYNCAKGQTLIKLNPDKMWQELNFADCITARYLSYE